MYTPPPDGRTRFTDRVDDYVRHRPGYPVALVGLLVAEHGLSASDRIADVGSGTGILTEMLLRQGNAVFAVEPNAEMRAAAEGRLAGRPGFHSIAGSAEATTLAAGSVDWVTAAQAFHWFDAAAAREEFRRILPAAGGPVALIWNDRREDTPFLAAFERFLLEHGTDYARVRHRDAHAGDGVEAFYDGAPVARHVLPNAQELDYDGLLGRVSSASYMPARSAAAFGPMAAALRALFEAHAERGRVAITYDTRVFVGRLRGRGAG